MDFVTFWSGFKWFLVVIFIGLILAIVLAVLGAGWDRFLRYVEALPELLFQQRCQELGIADTDSMSGRQFELWLARLFKDAGYKVQLTPYQGDRGADLIVTHPNGKRYAVQAKRFSGNVNVDALGEVLRGMHWYDCDGCMVVTNSDFTPVAREEAARAGIKLIGRKELADFVERVRKQKKSR